MVRVAAYESASLAIKLGTIEGDQVDLANNGIIGDFISSSAENTYGNINLAAATRLTLYTIHRTGEDMSVSNYGTVKAGSLENRIITGDAIRLSTSGSSTGTNKPFISIGQPSAGYDNRGAFLGFPSASEVPHFSLRSPSGDFLRYNGEAVQFSGDFSGGTIEQSDIVGGSISVPAIGEGAKFSVDVNGNVSASNASIGGIINADSGRIGDWIIDADTKALRDEDGEIVFEPNIPELQFYSGSQKKVVIGTNGELSDVSGSVWIFYGIYKHHTCNS